MVGGAAVGPVYRKRLNAQMDTTTTAASRSTGNRLASTPVMDNKKINGEFNSKLSRVVKMKINVSIGISFDGFG